MIAAAKLHAATRASSKTLGRNPSSVFNPVGIASLQLNGSASSAGWIDIFDSLFDEAFPGKQAVSQALAIADFCFPAKRK